MNNYTLVINSCFAYANKTLPPLIKSIIEFNPGFNVIIVVGGAPSSSLKMAVDRNIVIMEVTHNSFDFTAFIALLEMNLQLLTTPFLFFMHDTVIIGPKFFSTLLSIQVPESITSISFQHPSSNIGIYHRSVLHKFNDTILRFKNSKSDHESLNELKHLHVVIEDLIFRLNTKSHRFFPTKSIPNWGSTEDPYNSGTQRIKEYFPDLDFYKWKATWALADTYTLAA